MKSFGPYILVFLFITYVSFRDYRYKKDAYIQFQDFKAKKLVVEADDAIEPAVKSAIEAVKSKSKTSQAIKKKINKKQTAKKTQRIKPQVEEVAGIAIPMPADTLDLPIIVDSTLGSNSSKPAPKLALTGYNCDENIFVHCVAEFSFGDSVKKQTLDNLPLMLEPQASGIFRDTVEKLKIAKGIEVIEVDYQAATLVLENTSGTDDVFTDTLHLISIRQDSFGTHYSH